MSIEVQFVTFREEVLKTLLLVSSCFDCKELTIFSVLLGFSLLLKAHLYDSREEVLQTFVHTAKIDLQSQEPFVPFFLKSINWIGTLWRGTRRRSPVEGVKSIINFYF